MMMMDLQLIVSFLCFNTWWLWIHIYECGFNVCVAFSIVDYLPTKEVLNDTNNLLFLGQPVPGHRTCDVYDDWNFNARINKFQTCVPRNCKIISIDFHRQISSFFESLWPLLFHSATNYIILGAFSFVSGNRWAFNFFLWEEYDSYKWTCVLHLKKTDAGAIIDPVLVLGHNHLF